MGENKLFQQAKNVMDNSEYISIDSEALKDVSFNLAMEKFEIPGFDYYNYPEKGFEKINNWFAALNAINFYYKDKEGHFTIERNGKEIVGASAAAMIMTENKSFFSDADELRDIDQKTFEYLFTGKNGKKISKYQWRTLFLNDIGNVIEKNYDGNIDNLVEDSNHLLFNRGKGFVDIVSQFDSYKDISSHEGKEIAFNKRAQLLAGMIHGRAIAEGKKGFEDLNNLSVYADYVLPMVFQHWGILKVPEDYQKKIEKEDSILHNSKFEVEYRAATIRIADLMVDEINKTRLGNIKINNMMLDTYVWGLGRKLRKDYNLKHIQVETYAY